MNSATITVPQVELGKTGIVTSRLGIGAYGFGETSPIRARANGEAEIKKVLEACFAAGIRQIDSANAYNNEALMGRLLREIDTPKDLVLISKFGHGKGFAAHQFRDSVKQTLADYGRDHIDFLMVHDPRTAEHMKDIMAPGGALEELERMKADGLIRAIGVASGTYLPLDIAVSSGRFDGIQFPRGYHLLDQAGVRTGLFNRAKQAGMAVFNAGPFGANILATGAKPGALWHYRIAFPEVLASVGAMERRCAELGVTLPAAALAYSLKQPLIDTTIVGISAVWELEADLRALALDITTEDLESIANAQRISPELLGAPDYLRPWPKDREPPPPSQAT